MGLPIKKIKEYLKIINKDDKNYLIMKKYLVIGNPIEHSLSPRVHNFWFKENNIKAIYEKKKLDNNGLKDLVLDLRKKN